MHTVEVGVRGPNHAWPYRVIDAEHSAHQVDETARKAVPMTHDLRARLAEIIDRHADADTYLPHYNEAGECVSSAAADAVIAELGKSVQAADPALSAIGLHVERKADLYMGEFPIPEERLVGPRRSA